MMATSNFQENEIDRIPLNMAYRLLNHGPVTMITTIAGNDSSPNICAIAWVSTVAKNPPRFLISIGTGHKTHDNLKETSILAINIPTVELADLVMSVGKRTGHKTNKFIDFNIPIFYGDSFNTLPLVQSCAAWMECRVVERDFLPGHPNIIMVEAVNAITRKGVLTADQHWNAIKYPSLHHVGGNRFISANQDFVEGTVPPQE